MEENRPDPDKLLEQVKEEEEKSITGKLKIFFGYAAGVGKTYSMLEAAHQAAEAGVDVVAGYIEPHARPETAALLYGLEQLPPLSVSYRNMTLKEFDLDRALERKPQLILVDELAHTNAAGCRHTKRYQDIEELLKAGINVYTTVNVQHLESLNDIVASITGIAVQERIPDFVFDRADQVELVDIEPQELLERLKEGKVYRPKQAGTAMDHFFTADNLTALREIALRRTADQVNRVAEKNREQNRDSEYYTGEHILVCLSAAPSNAKVIRAAARIALAFKARFTAVHVEVPGGEALRDDDALRLRMNQRLAEQLGAKTVTLFGGDITRQIAEYIRISGVSKVVLGRSNTKRGPFQKNENFADQLMTLMPKLEIYLIPDTHSKPYAKKLRVDRLMEQGQGNFFKDFMTMAAIFGISTGLAFAFRELGLDESNIITVYILGVLLTALITENQIYSFLASALGVVCFNVFFTIPYHSLRVRDPGYLITFIIMFLAGFITAALAKKVKSYGRQAVKKAWRMETLLDTSQKLQMTSGERQIAETVAKQLVKLLDKDVVYYPGEPQEGEKPYCFPREKDSRLDELLTKDEIAVASWTYRNNKHAGASTGTLPGANGLYLAVRSTSAVYGVVGIDLKDDFLPVFEESVLNAILNETALALEKERNLEERNRAQLQMKQEQLRSNLLRSISHDLRTPLTSISGSSGILMEKGDELSTEQKKKLYEDIYDDSVWLYNLVENLLSVTKIENGSMELKMQPELLEDVIGEALSHIRRRTRGHSIKVHLDNEFLMAWMDARLLMQVIMNLVDNAIKYTPDNSHIEIAAREERGRIIVTVADDGEGIADDRKAKVFDLFYTGEYQASDGTRSMGVGLSLCRSIIEAHGGKIRVEDRIPHGTCFIFDLKAEAVGRDMSGEIPARKEN